jgi:hypothetical protein
MKVFFATLAVLVLAFAAIMTMQSHSTSHVKVAQQENMTQFGNDLAAFMKIQVVKEGESNDMGELYQKVQIEAKCKPNQGAYHTRCWVTITGPTGLKDKATAENVRRQGDKFVWDHES